MEKKNFVKRVKEFLLVVGKSVVMAGVLLVMVPYTLVKPFVELGEDIVDWMCKKSCDVLDEVFDYEVQ